MRGLIFVSGLLASFASASDTVIPMPFGIDFTATQSQIDEQLTRLDCRYFNSGQMCRYTPPEGSLFAFYEVQYTPESQKIITVMGTTQPLVNRLQCQTKMLEINDLIRERYQAKATTTGVDEIHYQQPDIGLVCTADNEFHIVYRNPGIDAQELDAEISRAQAKAVAKKYKDQF